MKNHNSIIIQFVKFGLVGISNTLITYIIYTLGLLLGFHYLIANTIGFFMGVFNGFYWSNKYVFKGKSGNNRNIWFKFIKTILSYTISGYLVSSFILWLLIDIVIIDKYIAMLISLLFTAPLNFVLNKYWAFNSIH